MISGGRIPAMTNNKTQKYLRLLFARREEHSGISSCQIISATAFVSAPSVELSILLQLQDMYGLLPNIHMRLLTRQPKTKREQEKLPAESDGECEALEGYE